MTGTKSTRRRMCDVVLFVAVGLLIAACGDGVIGATTTEAEGTPTTADEASETTAFAPDTTEPAEDDGLAGADLNLKIGHPSTITITDVISVITNERLNAQGWNVEDVEFARTGMNSQGLAQNSVQLSLVTGGDPLRAFQAGQAGGDDPTIRYVMDNNGGEFILIGKSEYPTCEDFDGIRFGIHGETSSISVAAVDYIRNECGVEPEILIVPGGENRIVALENDELDATLVQYSDWFELQRISDPDEYVVVDSGGTLDNFSGWHWWINMDWYEANPGVATAYVAEILRSCRMVHEDPSILAAAVLEHTETTTEETVDFAVETYLDPNQVNLCPENGGDPTMLQGIIDYNVAIDEIDPMSIEDAVHPTLLQDALDYLESNP